jgi:acyl-CoA dehydrogenase
MGADIEYPIHRYFLWGKQIELMLEGPSAQLARMGSALAARYRQPGSAPAASGGGR